MAFKSLVSAVSEQCQEIRQTLSSISYFSDWDATAIAECSRLSSLEEFPPKEVILGSGTGSSHTVYFILDGVCRMIQYLQVETKTNSRGETKYNLYKSVGETQNCETGSIGYASILFNKKYEFQSEKITEQDAVKDEVYALEDGRTKETEGKDSLPVAEAIEAAPEGSIHSETDVKQTENTNNEDAKKDVIYEEDHHIKILQESRKKLKSIIWVNKKDASHDIPRNVNGYFIQTGSLFKGACFGLKKYTDKNFIMSETVVKCLKIPQRFLLHHNPCNIWNRILLFDSLYIPKEEKILECFQTDRKWVEAKRKLVEDIVSKKNIPNYTGISDVPYSIRLTDERLCNSDSKMGTNSEQPCYTLINLPSDMEQMNEMQLKMDLEKGDVKTKIEALKKTIHMILSGEKLPGILMTIIRFVLPLQDHMIKKLLLIFWEIVPKTNPEGKLMQEMILVCDAYRKDLQHPNEFLRGSTLRFLCKLKEPELLEPLMPAIRACLEHRHSYVRRNAVLAIFTIYRNFEFLIPDAPELIANFLEGEQDMSCKRNAFLMLLHADQERALNFLASCLDQVNTFGDILQLVIVELIYKVCHVNPSERSRFIRCIYNLLNSSSQAVRYEAAGTLVTLSSAPTAVKAAATCYIEIIIKESDNNVKLIVLDRLIALKDNPTHEKVLQDLVMDILRVLSSPDLEVRKKTLNLAMELVSSRNIEEMVLMLKKEVTKTHNVVEHEDTGKYRQLLVRTLHSCCIKFPDIAATVIPVLIEFLSDSNELAATDVLVFIREAIHKFENLRPLIIEKLIESFTTIKSVKVHRAALWILGEYASLPDDIQTVMSQVRQTLGDIPIVEDELKREAGEKTDDDLIVSQGPVQKLVTSDGTYATQSSFSTLGNSKKTEARPPLRQYLIDGDFFIGAALGTTLAKLALRYNSVVKDTTKRNRFTTEAMLIMSSILHLGKSGIPVKAITNDDADRLLLCLRVLSESNTQIENIFNENCRRALSIMLAANALQESSLQKAKEKSNKVNEPDDPITFLQLSSLRGGGDFGGENLFELSLNRAVVGGKQGSGADFTAASSKLNKVTQLTGFSDPVYSEAYVHVNQYDIVLDVLIVNQTGDTLQNCTLELATLGDLKLVEKPQPVVLAPHDFCNIKASVKVASTENGIIFGNIVYDVSGAASDRNVVVLNDIHIDIMDYIVPANCNDTEFRQMWAEFEWENKVSVSTNLTDLHEYLQHLIKSTNMKCLTPEKALSGQCGFMAANMYAKSIFGEDALANLSIEKPFNKPEAPVIGHIRIRAKSQGMALSLGDKIKMAQKVPIKVCA